jgi:hypothetical protein
MGAAAAAVVLAYVAAQAVSTNYVGLTRASGWAVYARTGQFADCRKFTPPAGTARLCQSSPPARRPGTDFYFWVAESPARQLFGRPPHGNKQLGAFGRAAILNQPLDYVRTVAHEFARYVWPTAYRRALDGKTQEQFLTQARNAYAERYIIRRLRLWYHGIPAVNHEVAPSAVAYSRIAKLEGIPLLLVLLLAVSAPLAVGPGRRAMAALFAVTGLVLLIAPVATQVYDARYAIPALWPLVVAAAMALPRVARVPATAVRRLRREASLRAEASPDPVPRT